MFASSKVLKEFLIYCPKEEPRRIAYSIIKLAVKTIYPEEKSLLAKPSDAKSSLIMTVLNAVLKETVSLIGPYSGQYFQLLIFFAELDPGLHSYLANNEMVGVSLEIMKVTKSNQCCMNLANSLKSFDWNNDTFFPLMNSELPYACSSDRVIESKFSLTLIKNLMPASFTIKKYSLENDISIFKEPDRLNMIFYLVKDSKVAISVFSQVLSILFDYNSSFYFNSIDKFFSNGIKATDLSDVLACQELILKFLMIKNEPQRTGILLNVLSEMRLVLEPYSVVISYIDFVISVYLNIILAMFK